MGETLRVFESLKGAADASGGLFHIRLALERIADALERLSPVPPSAEEDESVVSYVDYREEVALEQRQANYELLTGIRLAPGVEPPSAEKWLER